MDFREVDLETPAGTLADSLAQIFLMTTNSELRQQAYQMVGVDNNRDFALAVEARLNEYFQGKQRKLDRRSILQIRKEKDNASIILEHFLKTAGLPPDAVKKFCSKNLSTRIKMLERNVNQRSFLENYLIEMANNNSSNIDSSIPGRQDRSKRKQLDFLKAGPSIIRDEFSASSEDEVSNMLLSKKQLSSQSKSFHFPAKVDKRDEIGREKNLKPSYNSMDFDEFSDFNDELEIENHPKLDAMKTNEKNQFSNYLDAEFSSSDDTEFSSTNDSDFPRSKEESVTAFKNVT